MERLTERERNVDGTGVAKEEITDGLLKPFADKILTKLAVYEDLEEQGLLVRLPTNKNKEIYIISSRWTVCSEYGLRFDEYSCIGCEYECDSEKEYYIHSTYLSFIDVTTYVNQFGKTVFLTREEAAKKLEEMKNDKA